MYSVSIFNNGIEMVIHYPDTEAPHISTLPLKEGLSLVDNLSFNIYTNNSGYNNIFELSTKVKVIDTVDGSIRFTGRVLYAYEQMDSTGLFYKNIVCEGALSYLGDSKQRDNAFLTTNPTDFLTQILAIHNGKVDSSKKILVGNIDVVGNVAYSCSFETTLDTIIAVNAILTTSGDIKVRETAGVLYLDWLQSFNINTVDVVLGTNMVDMVKSKDVTTFGTRIIPLGANNLLIGTPDYIEDPIASAVYGVIEKTVEYKDITDATVLYNTCLSDLSKYTQPLLLLESSALDLSFLTGIKAEQFILGTNIHIVNPVMAVDDIYQVVQIDSDLLEPYNPKLTIANAPPKLTTALSDLRASSVQNDGVYNSVQIGDSFGIRVVRSDGKVITTLNATDVITVENESKKVFYLDENGNIVCNDITANNMTANEGTFNGITAQGGTFTDITANNIDAIGGVITGATIQTALTGARLVLNSNDFSSYNTANINTFKITNNNIQFYDNATGALCGSIDGSGEYVQVAATTGFNINIGSLPGLGVYGLDTMIYNNFFTDGVTGRSNNTRLNIGSTGAYLETVSGRFILHLDINNYVSIESGSIRTFKSGVGGEIATQTWVTGLGYCTYAAMVAYVNANKYVPPAS